VQLGLIKVWDEFGLYNRKKRFGKLELGKIVGQPKNIYKSSKVLPRLPMGEITRIDMNYRKGVEV